MKTIAGFAVSPLTGLALSVLLWTASAGAQQLAQDPEQVVRSAVAAEMNAVHTDDSHWRYRDNERDKGLISFVVETPQGAVKQPVLKGGHPLTQSERAAAEAETQKFVSSPDLQRKQQRDAENDDKQAQEFLNMLPNAFVWKIDSVSGGLITLSYEPNPEFHAPSMEGRVMGQMSGQMMVDAAQYRIRTLKGQLMQDVTIGWGVLGRLKAGGTFDVERRQVGPGKWEITATSVHINGHALFFKSISENQDEVKTDFIEVPNSTTLAQGVSMLHSMVDGETSAPSTSRASR